MNLQSELEKIKKTEVHGLNIFDAVGMKTQEVKHSVFFAYLLNPKKPHGLHNSFLKSFLFAVYNYIQPEFERANAEIINFSLKELLTLAEDEDLQVQTERQLTIQEGGRIDICLEAQNAKTLFVIENKVFTSTHDEQLSRYEKEFADYKDYKKVFVYLTPEGDLPYEGDKLRENWCIFSYREILKIIKELKPTNRKFKYLMEDYVEMVDTNILKGNKELSALCKKIRREHKDALEILFKYTDNAERVVEYCLEYLTANVVGFCVQKQTPLYFSFYTQQTAEYFARYGEKLLNENGDLRCSGSLRCPDGPVVLGFGTTKSRDESWSAAQLKLMREFAPAKVLTEMYFTFQGNFIVKALAEEERELPFEEVKERLTKLLKVYSDKINEFNTRIQSL